MKYKVGDKVRIVNKRTLNMPSNGAMDKYLGTVMTINIVLNDAYKMEEDAGKWYWVESDIQKIFLYSKPTKEELLNMPAGTKIITESEDKKHTEYYYDGSDFESQETYLKAFQINEDLTINNNTKIIKIEIPVYEILYEY